MKSLIFSMPEENLQSLVARAISEGRSISPNYDPDRKYAEAWIRGWCDKRTTLSLQETLVIYLHNYNL